MKKFFFFDIDGTLTNDNPGGIVLPSTFKTLDKLRANGHFVAIATGRAHWMAMEFSKTSKIDNLVCDGGNGLVINGKLLGIEPLNREICLEIIDECLENHFPFAVSLGDNPQLYSCNDWINGYHLPGDLIIDETLDFHQVDQIFKIFIMATPKQESLLKSIHKLGYMRYHGDQLIVEPIEKYQGILKMVDILKGNPQDIVVFGDGINDISMMKQAPCSIAMGNAIDEVKTAATFVTKTSKEEGIEFACKYYGWIA